MPRRRHATVSAWVMVPAAFAQRRPGLMPRRHGFPGVMSDRAITAQRRAGADAPATRVRPEAHGLLVERSTKAGADAPATHGRDISRAFGHLRSTKAGADAPATPRSFTAKPITSLSAQRRPGLMPRRHLVELGELEPSVDRSTKAGADAPATPLGKLDHVGNHQERSTKAGADAPATPDACHFSRASRDCAQRRPGLMPRRHRSGMLPRPMCQLHQ